MSMFDRALENHNAEIERKKQERDKAALEKKNKEQLFNEYFYEKTRAIAKPIFEEFVADARRNNFSAYLKEDEDRQGAPNITVRVNMVVGATTTPNSRDIEDIYYTIRGISHMGAVEHTYCYNQRRGASGMRAETHAVSSINEELIRRNLQELWESALKARR